jgi:hypothetical protein
VPAARNNRIRGAQVCRHRLPWAGQPVSGVSPSKYWTELRQEILSLLEEKDADAAELYRTAVESLTTPLTRPALMITGHCVRELIKVLPVVLGYPVIERADASRSARELSKQWTASGLPLSDDDGASEPEAVALPIEVVIAAREVANAGAAGSRNSRELTALIVTGLTSDAETASVKRVHKSIEMFRQWAHARDYTKPARPVPALERVVGELEIIEEALMNRLGNMADRAKSVRELLAGANRRDEAQQ